MFFWLFFESSVKLVLFFLYNILILLVLIYSFLPSMIFFFCCLDPEVFAPYKMEVLRDPESKVRPLFRVTVDGGEQVGFYYKSLFVFSL